MKQSNSITDSTKHHQFSLPLTTSLFYEPTSVLDPHLTSSPAINSTAATTAAVPIDPPLLPWANTTAPDSHQNHHINSEDWDPVAWLFSEKDDISSFPKSSLPFSDDLSFDQFTTTDPAIPPPDVVPFDRSHLDYLLRAAHCVENNDLATANVILSRLNHQFSFAPSPLQRSALLYVEALLSFLHPSPAHPPPSASELVRHIAAQRAFADLSPVPHFITFTTAQTLLETLDATAQSIHLIDFDLGLGGLWSAFAQELAVRNRGTRYTPPSIRITAIVSEESAETSLARENLHDFARGLGLRLTVNVVRVGGLGTLALENVRLGGVSEPVSIVITPAVFQLLGGGVQDTLLRFILRASPRAVVFADAESGGAAAVPGTLQRAIGAGVELNAAVIEALEAAAGATGAGEEPVRWVERAVIRPRVLGSVGAWCGPQPRPWRELLGRARLSPVQFSDFAASQAEMLVQRAHVEGYHVARREGAMVLSWRGTELATTSAWRC